MPGPNPAVKAAGVVAGMVAGADSFADLELLRTGPMKKMFTGVRAPSTLGTFLRKFTHGHARQLDSVNRRSRTGLTRKVPDLLAGGDGFAMIDVDDTIREVHGYQKQGAAFGGVNLGVETPVVVFDEPTANLAGQRTPTPAMYPAA